MCVEWKMKKKKWKLEWRAGDDDNELKVESAFQESNLIVKDWVTFINFIESE